MDRDRPASQISIVRSVQWTSAESARSVPMLGYFDARCRSLPMFSSQSPCAKSSSCRSVAAHDPGEWFDCSPRLVRRISSVRRWSVRSLTTVVEFRSIQLKLLQRANGLHVLMIKALQLFVIDMNQLSQLSILHFGIGRLQLLMKRFQCLQHLITLSKGIVLIRNIDQFRFQGGRIVVVDRRLQSEREIRLFLF